jgi:phytoene dehydrogenase-like protein
VRDADVIIVGSGLGALAAGVGLARAGQRVLMFERHQVPGGHCQSFHLDSFRFSPGVHYVGDVQEGGVVRTLLEGLGAAPDFFELRRDAYEHCVLGEQRFDYCAGRDALAERFAQHFPSDAHGVAAVLKQMETLHQRLLGGFATRSLSRMQGYEPRAAFFSQEPIGTLVNQWVKDPACRALLTVHTLNYGVAASRAPVAVHATNLGHYLNGGWHPRGGGAGLVKALLKPFRAAGGQLELDTAVSRILVEGGRAVGVRLADGRELRSTFVVSNADPQVTWSRLVGDEWTPAPVRAQLDRARWSAPVLSLFLVVDTDVRRLGLDSGNVWSAPTDWETAFRDAGQVWSDTELPFFLSCSTLKDPTHFDGRHHVLELSATVAWAPFAQWAASAPGQRPPEYERLKQHLAGRLLRSVERVVPGLTSHIVAKSVGTPLTNQHYVGVTEGAPYGVEKTRAHTGPNAFRVMGDLDGLALCGSSTTGHGVLGATLSGVAAAAGVLGVTLGEVLTSREVKVRTWAAEDASGWPEDVRAAVQRRRRA